MNACALCEAVTATTSMWSNPQSHMCMSGGVAESAGTTVGATILSGIYSNIYYHYFIFIFIIIIIIIIIIFIIIIKRYRRAQTI